MAREVSAHTVWRGAHVATMDVRASVPFGLIDDGALVTSRSGRIVWLGQRAKLPREFSTEDIAIYDLGGCVVTPGLIDCHTHLVYAGNRALEFEMRLQGAHYAELARAGGGILSTVRATRAAAEGLEASSERRIAALAASGVTTLEIKSGYGLDRVTEITMLRAARALAQRYGVGLRTTYLGLHAQPPEYAERDDYVDFVIGEMLPAIAAERLAETVDAFCETIGFSAAQTARYFTAARALGFDVKLHADQLSDGGGAELAARFGALSADHLEHASPEGLRQMARAGTVAVLLPGATYFLRESKLPPLAEMRRLNIPFAIATDCNPGTSPLVSMPLALNLACTLFRITPEEALAGATRNAARALGLQAEVGTLSPGLTGTFVAWEIDHPRELAYAIGANPVRAVVKSGMLATRAPRAARAAAALS